MSTGVFKISISANLIWGISNRFQLLSPTQGQILYILLTRPPLSTHRSELLVRLACMKHAASVRPEPGSNSPLSESLCPSLCFAKNITARLLHFFVCCSVHFIKINRYFVFSYSVFNVLFAWAKNLPSSRKVNHSPPTFLPLLPRRFKSYHQDFLLSSVILTLSFLRLS